MTLLINDKLGDQLFANNIGTLINSINSTSKTEEKTICIRKDRLKVIVNHATKAGSESEVVLKECVEVASAALAVSDNQDGDEDELQNFISLSRAIDTLESIVLEQNSLTDDNNNQNIVTNALMGETLAYNREDTQDTQ